MKLFLGILLAPALCLAAILPETIGDFHRTAVSAPALSDRQVWDEYGLKEAETASYEGADAKFTVTAWRLQDTTGALAAFDWQRPAAAAGSKAAPLAAETGKDLIAVHGNYLLWFEGHKPDSAEFVAVTGSLRNVDTTALPVLPSYLPAEALVANSERYIVGPSSLQKFNPGISAATAGFHLGAEAQLGVFHSGKGDQVLSIFNYPTPQIAMQKVGDFEKLQGSMVKRSGPLVAIIQNSPDPELSERLLGAIRWQAAVTRSEYVPTRRDNIANLVLNALYLCGILLVFMFVSGLAVGGLRAFLRRGGRGNEADAMITLNLERR